MKPPLSFAPSGLNLHARTDGGLSKADAVKAVDARLALIKTDSLASLDQLIEMMLAEKPALGVDVKGAGERLCDLSSQVVGVAGPFCPPEVSGAAGSLCELIEYMKVSGKWSVDAVAVHVDSLKLLRAMPDPSQSAAREHILAGLHRITSQASPADLD